MATPWTQELKDKIIEMHSKGMINTDIANELKMTRKSITTFVAKQGLKSNRLSQHEITVRRIKSLKKTPELEQKIDFVLEVQNETLRVMRLIYEHLSTKKRLAQSIQ